MRDGTGEPVFHTAPRARGRDLEPVCELPYRPAADERPQQRPNRCQHLTTRNTVSKILLALTEAFSNRICVVNCILIAAPGSRFSPRSERSAATSGSKRGRCNVHSGLAWCFTQPKALRRSRLHPRPVGQSSHPRRTPGWILVKVSSDGRLLGPMEWLPRPPHAMQNHGKFSGKRHARLTGA